MYLDVVALVCFLNVLHTQSLVGCQCLCCLSWPVREKVWPGVI